MPQPAVTLIILAGLAGSSVIAGAPARAAALSPPRPTAPAAMLVEPTSGEIVFERAAHQRRRMASTTKLMTALLTLEQSRLSAHLRAVRYIAQPAESVAGFRAGERLTVADLLRALLLVSANDAAATLAKRIGGSTPGFVALMNRRARQLGLHGTHYANPIGLDAPGNYSTPADLIALAREVRRNAFARQVMDRGTAVLHSGDRPRQLQNRNTLVRDVPWVSGVKTGHTAGAGYVLVGSARRAGVEMISVVMGDPSEAARNIDTLALLGYGLAQYRRVAVVRAGVPVASVRVKDQGRTVELVAPTTVRAVVRRGAKASLVPTALPAEVNGPLERGARIGTLVVRSRGRTLARVPLVTRTSVTASSVWQRHPWMVMVLAGLALTSSAAVAVASLKRKNRRRARQRTRRSRSETA